MQTFAKFPFLPPQASSGAAEIDYLLIALNAVAIFFSAGIFVALIWLAVYYRQGNKVNRANPVLHSTSIEVIWTVIPLLICLGLFAWATALFLNQRRIPANAMEIHVVGKQWMWKLQQPNGRWEMNQLHVPVGQPIRLAMTSEDVIHSFFVPAFRLKTDVIPGQFTYLWFKPTRPGTYHLFCAEFCGTEHSKMRGKVIVMERTAYQKWLNEGNQAEAAVQVGAGLFQKHGCSGCHNPGSSVRAPMLAGIFGRQVPIQIPKQGTPLSQIKAETITADNRYLYDSIVLPEKEIAAGYRAIMPTYRNRLTNEEVFQLVAYLRSMGRADAPKTNLRQDNTNTLGASDYEARVGFIPENIKGNGVGGGGRAGSNVAPANERTGP